MNVFRDISFSPAVNLIVENVTSVAMLECHDLDTIRLPVPVRACSEVEVSRAGVRGAVEIMFKRADKECYHEEWRARDGSHINQN